MKYFYLLAFLILPSIVFAQSNYHEGYILKTNGDTVKGFINYREWERAPKKIDFKLNKSDKADAVYSAENIKGFGIYGMERYISFIGVVTMGSNSFPDLPTGIDSTKQVDTLFLKQAATGKYLTLYANKDDIKTRLFIAEPGAGPSELIYYTYYNDVQQIVSSPQFKGQLLLMVNKAAPGNPGLMDEISRLNYTEPDVARVVDHINGVSRKKAIDSRFFIGAGLNFTTSETGYVENTNTIKRSNILVPKIGIGLDFFNNPQVQKFIFRVELSASYVTPRFLYLVTVLNKPTNEIYEYNQYSATITPQLLLNIYNKDNFKFYLDAGWSFNFSTYSKNKFTIEYAPADVTKAETIDKPYLLEKYWSNFPMQAGIVLNKRIEIFGTYTPFAAYTKYELFYASNRSIGFGAKLLMGK